MATRENSMQKPDGSRVRSAGPHGKRGLLKVMGMVMLIVALTLVCGLAALLTSCGGAGTEATTTSTTVAATGTVQIGYLGWLTGIQGTQFYNSVKAYDAMIQAQGGIMVGADRYNVQLDAYDTNNDQNTAVAGANKLIFEDKVKYMCADSFLDAFIADSEANSVLVSAKSAIPPQLTPDNKYLFNTGFSNAESAVAMRWFVETYPDLKHIMFILPDFELGHIIAMINAAIAEQYGMTVDQEFYTLGNPDMSSLGTKVKTVNPDVVCLFEMSPLRAIREAGWTGQFFSVATNSVETLLATASAEDIEGFIGTAYPTEFDPCLTQTATDFKAAYTTLFGSWDNPAPSDTALYSSVVAALQQAGSLDVDAVTAILADGMEWDSPCGPLKMVARPDVGNTRTVDSINTIYVKKIVAGKAVLLDTVDLTKAESWFNDYLANATPMVAP